MIYSPLSQSAVRDYNANYRFLWVALRSLGRAGLYLCLITQLRGADADAALKEGIDHYRSPNLLAATRAEADASEQRKQKSETDRKLADHHLNMGMVSAEIGQLDVAIDHYE